MEEVVISKMTSKDRSYKIGGLILGAFLIYSFTTDREVAYNQQINGFIPKEYSLYFLYSLFSFSKEFIQNNSTSSMKGMISKGTLSDLEYIVPPLSLQKEFAQKVEVIEKQKEALEESLELMEENYKSIMGKAFKGQLFN